MSTILETIGTRFCVRNFRPESVPKDTIEKILEAACRAPSAGNQQPWEFYVVSNTDLKRDLALASRNFIAQAPIVIVVCVVPKRTIARYGVRGKELYCIQDTAAAIQNILLAATSLKLGSCWVGDFAEEKVVKILELTTDKRPIAIIPIGYPAEKPARTERLPLEDVTKWL